MSQKLEYAAFIVVILLFLYAIWFVVTHSNPVTFSDLMTFGGVLIAGATILFSLVFTRFGSIENRLNQIESKVDGKISIVESKLDDLVKEVHFIKGKLETKN